jgi:hypothetical protein
MVVPTRALQTSLYSRGKDAKIKKIKLRILICYNPPTTKHSTPLHQRPHIFLIPLRNGSIFVALEELGGELQMLFELEKQRNNV